MLRLYDADMFGGRDQVWTLRTRHASIHRVIRQEIDDKWQYLDVQADNVEITDLPDGMFIRWDGRLHLTMKVVVGNIPARLQPDILKIARELFAQVKHRRRRALKG